MTSTQPLASFAPAPGAVTKAVIPAAGLGTRFLPATKATPKEMLPVVDKPAIQYVVEEATRAGLRDVLMVTGRNKSALEDHFDRHWELERALEAKGDELRLARVRKSTDLGNIHYVRQGEPLGLGHAVLCARDHVGNNPFAVLLGDDLIDDRDHLLEAMISVRAAKGGSVIALMEVPPESIHLYGCAAIDASSREGDDGSVVRVTGLVEKPEAAEAPSNLAVIGRYVLDPSIFETLAKTAPGRGGEIQLTDALKERAESSEAGGGVHGVIFRGRRYDTGDRLDYLKAVVRLAVEHRELGSDFSSWLTRFVAERESAKRELFTTGLFNTVITVVEHLARIIGTVRRLPPIGLNLLDAQGCVLAEDVTSEVPLPGFTNSAMDGYAVHAADLAAASGTATVTLPVVHDIAAGNTQALSLAPGQSMRIMTGAPMPHGADAVVPVELTDGGLAKVTLSASVPVGASVRQIGEDVMTGDVVMRSGTRLEPRQIALLAAVGCGRVPVTPKPRVVVISTGDELIEPGTRPGFGQVVDSNGLMLTAAVRALDCIPFRVGCVRDDPRTFLATIESQLLRADAVITTGGVSMGAYDTVKEVLSRVGTMRFDKVAMQPGMPQGFGVLGEDEIPVFTLPGNPVSAMVSFEVFVAPALRVMAGRLQHESPLVTAVATHDWTAPADKVQFARVVLSRSGTGHTVAIAGLQGSHALGGLAGANALAVIPADVTLVRAGDKVRCHPLGPIVEAL